MPTNLERRVAKLEDIVAEHLSQSGSIQTTLKFNTAITLGIAIAVISKLALDLFIK